MGKYNEVLETKLYTCIGTPQIIKAKNAKNVGVTKKWDKQKG